MVLEQEWEIRANWRPCKNHANLIVSFLNIFFKEEKKIYHL